MFKKPDSDDEGEVVEEKLLEEVAEEVVGVSEEDSSSVTKQAVDQEPLPEPFISPAKTVAEEAKELTKKIDADVASVKVMKEEVKPVWRDPASGKVVSLEERRHYLRTSAPYKECWDGVLARVVKQLGKAELEKRIAKVAAGTASIATVGQAFCALAECNGVVAHAVTKLKLAGYRDEMALAVEVCNVGQYVRVSTKKKSNTGSTGEEKKEKRKSKKSNLQSDTNASAGKAEWKDPITGEVIDAAARREHLLQSASYRACWEEVLGKLVQSSGKGDVEKNIARICAALPEKGRIIPEVAFCALAECAGVPQHAIVKLRHPGYVEEMKLAVECCNAGQYLKVTKKSPKKK
jgi:hypothetical protein